MKPFTGAPALCVLTCLLITLAAWGQTTPAPPTQMEPGERNSRDLATVVPDAHGEIGEISTDRPDYTESTEVVGRRMIQFENGFTLSGEKGVSSLSTGELLMRVGLSKRIEFRFGADGFLAEWAPTEVVKRGFSDIEFAAKIRLFDQTRYLPAVSLIPIVSAPGGTRLFSSQGFDPTVKLAWSKDLPRGFSLGGNLNASSLTSPEGRFTQWSYSWSLGHSLPGGFEGYWEIFSFAPWDQGQPSAWIANSGVSHKLGRNAQIDVRVGKRLTAAGPDWFFGAGVAIRRPWGGS